MRKTLGLLTVIGLTAALGACGHGTEQRAATGALGGALVGGPVGAAVGAAGGAVISKGKGE